MEKKRVVSFCISTYNRENIVDELVRNILSSQNQNFEVVVVDDCSDDRTVERLEAIKDSRLRVYKNEIRGGASACWYKALEKGEGDWLFQVLDRDWVDMSKMDTLIMSLQDLDKKNVAFAVAGERFSNDSNYEVYDEGIDTLCEFSLRYSHPTGQIFRRENWEGIKDKAKYFLDEKYGIYPHGYLYTILGNSKKGAYLLFDICDKAHYQERVLKTVSKFYSSQSEKKEWFWPESRYKLLILAANNIELVENKAFIKEIMLTRYIQFFNAVTKEWYGNCHNEVLKKRYGRPDLQTNYIELMVNGFDYVVLFREFLEEHNFYWADKEFYKVLVDIDKQLLGKMLDWTNALREM